MATVAIAVATAPAQSTLTLQAQQAGPPWRGWGTSIAWWGNPLESWPEPQFNELMDAVWSVEHGLGLNIARYNIGGGQNPIYPDSYMGPGREMEGFLPESGGYDWTADAGQRRVLRAAIDRGVDVVEAFSNSPPYWMTISRDASGNGTGNTDGTDNLAQDDYLLFGLYLANVAKQFRDGWDVHFHSMVPLNEPTAAWWDGNGGQEGCVFSRGRHPALYDAVRTALDGVGLPELPVSGPEEFSTRGTRDSFESYPQATRDLLSHVSTHTYGGGDRGSLDAWAMSERKPLWVSEYNNDGADPLDSGLKLASRIALDISSMPHVSAWVTWQVVEAQEFSHHWGQIRLFFNGGTNFVKRHQYDTTAQFSRYIRPGSRMIPSGRDDVVIAYDRARERLTVVCVNDTAQAELITLGLDALGAHAGTARMIRTSQNERQAELDPVAIIGGSLPMSLPPRSVTTYLIEDALAPTVPAQGQPLDADAVLGFIADLNSGDPAADLNGDYTSDAFDLVELMHSVYLDAQAETVYEQGFELPAFLALDPIELGNRDQDGYWIYEDSVLMVQAFLPQPDPRENGGVAFELDGVDLEPGRVYRFELDAGDFPQGWTIGGPLLVGLSTAAPGVDEVPDIVRTVTTFAPDGSGGQDVSFDRYVLQFSVPVPVQDPWMVIRTDGIDLGQQRIGIDRIAITTIPQP